MERMSEEVLEFDARGSHADELQNIFVVTAHTRAQSGATNDTSRFPQSNRAESQQLTAGFDDPEPVDDYTESANQLMRNPSYGQANTDNLLQRLTDSAARTNFAKIDLNDDDSNEAIEDQLRQE